MLHASVSLCAKTPRFIFLKTKVMDCEFVQCLSCKLLKQWRLRMHQDLGKVYKLLKSGDLLLRTIRFPQGFPQNSGNLILRQCRPDELYG